MKITLAQHSWVVVSWEQGLSYLGDEAFLKTPFFVLRAHVCEHNYVSALVICWRKYVRVPSSAARA